MKQADLRDMFLKASKSVCSSNVVVSPDPMSLTSSTSSANKIKKKEDHDYPEPADVDGQMEHSSN
jgi:hypothetical protein